jgi:hypothetical protein
MKRMVLMAMALMVGWLLTAAPARAAEVGGRLDQALVAGGNDSAVSIRLSGPEEKKEGHERKANKENNENKEPSGWGGGGGFVLTYLMLDVSALDPMTSDRNIDNFSNGLYLIGGKGGLIYQDFRFGGFGFGNSWEKSHPIAGKFANAEMSIGGGGVYLEFNHAFSSNLGAGIGAMIGAGSMDLTAHGKDLGPDGKWHANESFFMAYPYVCLWGAPMQYFWLQLDAGYLIFNMDTGDSKFKNDLGVKMVDGDLRGGFQLALEINFGYLPQN